MTFITLNYFLLLVATFIVYYAINNNYKYWVIFFASILFILSLSANVLLFSLIYTGLNYFGGLLLHKYNDKANLKKIIFWTLIGSNTGILIFYKYINFIIENINTVLDVFCSTSKIDPINLILPVGISYFTFQSIGYLISINRGFEMPEKNFIVFSSFLLFFPKFLAGPIERSKHFLMQIRNPVSFDQSAVSNGLRLILFGVFKKIVIANNLYDPISSVYANVQHYTGIPLITVLLIQLIYVYCDFSGYTDIALGSAKLFGINIIDNFNRPFLAKTITEFWKRWHISLSSWCNEFIFIPFIVKYRKLGTISSILGIFLTFLIIGIWHGANWTFFVLGLLQAIAIVYEFFTKKYRLKLVTKLPIWFANAISRILVILFMGISMIFFFSNSVKDALYFISHLFQNVEFKFSGNDLKIDKPKFFLAICCFLILFGIEIINENGYNLKTYFFKQSKWIRWAIYYTLMILIYIFYSNNSAFKYQSF